MFARRTSNIAISTFALLLGISLVLLSHTARTRATHAESVVLWVQEVRGKALYWVNDKPCGRAPLSGLDEASRSKQIAALTVILDSHVAIQEMAEIEGLKEKMGLRNVRYFVFDRAYPNTGMSEIVWRPQNVPLPMSPPKIGAR